MQDGTDARPSPPPPPAPRGRGRRRCPRRLLELVRDARALTGPVIAAIGPGTARALREHGIEPDVVPGGHLLAKSRPAELADQLEAYLG